MPSLPNIGTEKVTGFNIQSNNAIDASRTWVSNQTTRLEIEFPYYGLITTQGDTGQLFKYIGNENTNELTDWELYSITHSGSGIPNINLGVLGDNYIDYTNKILYEKTAVNIWTNRGVLGSEWLLSTGTPNDGSGRDGDIYLNTTTGDYYKKVGGSWGTVAGNLKGPTGNDGQDASGVSYYASLYATNGTVQTLTAASGYEKITTFNSLDNVRNGIDGSSVNDNFTILNDGIYSITFEGIGVLDTLGICDISFFKNDTLITSKKSQLFSTSEENFSLNLTVSLVTNDVIDVRIDTDTDLDFTLISGVFKLFTIGAQGLTGDQGKAFTVTEADINLNETKINTVQAGSYTQSNPYVASILNDTRTNKSLPFSIAGELKDKVISYDGSSWTNYGIWRGPKGDTGIQGIQGIQGQKGDSGISRIINTVFSLINGTINLVGGSTDKLIEYRVYSATGGADLILALPEFVRQSQNLGGGYRVVIYTNNLQRLRLRSATNSGNVILNNRASNQGTYYELDLTDIQDSVITCVTGGNDGSFININGQFETWIIDYPAQANLNGLSEKSWNNLSLHSGNETTIQPITVDYRNIIQANSRVYPTKTIVITTAAVVTLDFYCTAKADSDNVDNVSAYIEYITPGGSSYTVIKRKIIPLRDNSDQDIHIKDIIRLTTTGNYLFRLRITHETVGQQAFFSNAAEYEIKIEQDV